MKSFYEIAGKFLSGREMAGCDATLGADAENPKSS